MVGTRVASIPPRDSDNTPNCRYLEFITFLKLLLELVTSNRLNKPLGGRLWEKSVAIFLHENTNRIEFIPGT